MTSGTTSGKSSLKVSRICSVPLAAMVRPYEVIGRLCGAALC